MPQTTRYELDPATSISVIVSGHKTQSNPTLIFLHFWGGSSLTFARTISHLPSDFHCIAVDFRGWGSSTGPHTADAYSMTHLATDIETLIPKLDVENFILVGHSMGGKVSQLLAGRNKHPLELPPDMKQQQISACSSRESAEFVARNVLSASDLPDEMVAAVVEDMLRGNEFATKEWPTYGMAEDIVAEARRITVPVLVIGGELDKVEWVERLKMEVLGNVAKADMVVIKGSGHLLPVEAPHQVAGNIEYFVRKIVI